MGSQKSWRPQNNLTSKFPSRKAPLPFSWQSLGNLEEFMKLSWCILSCQAEFIPARVLPTPPS